MEFTEQVVSQFRTSLTPGETTVAVEVSLGYTSPEIARRLNLSFPTVRNYLNSIYAKVLNLVSEPEKYNRRSLLVRLMREGK